MPRYPSDTKVMSSTPPQKLRRRPEFLVLTASSVPFSLMEILFSLSLSLRPGFVSVDFDDVWG